MRSEGFLLLSGGLGGGPCSRCVRPSVRECSQASASVRMCPRGAVPLGLARKASRLACLVVVSRGRRGESWPRVRVAGPRIGVSRGRRGEVARQAWGFRRVSPLGKVLGGGSAWQVW